MSNDRRGLSGDGLRRHQTITMAPSPTYGAMMMAITECTHTVIHVRTHMSATYCMTVLLLYIN